MRLRCPLLVVTMTILIPSVLVAAPPVLDPIGPQAALVDQQLVFTVTATDPDGPAPFLIAQNRPFGAEFSAANGSGTFTWTPTLSQLGDHVVRFIAFDSQSESDTELVTITVTTGNPPVLNTIGPQSTRIGETLQLLVWASDADGTTPSLSTSPLPSTASFVDNGDGTGDFTWTPESADYGDQEVMFYASDAVTADIDSELVLVFIDGDPGIPDSILVNVAQQPNAGSGQFNVILEIYAFNDSLLSSVSAPFSWDNPDMRVDSAKASNKITNGLDGGVFFFEDESIAESNANRRIVLGGFAQNSGIEAATERELWATYYFTVENWQVGDSIVIDTTTAPPNSVLFTAVDLSRFNNQTSYVPTWSGQVVIQDASVDVKTVTDGSLPLTFSLGQNYPNPFNPVTNIEFAIPTRSHVTLTIYNVLGREVNKLVDEEMAAGEYVVDWNGTSSGGSAVSSAVYFYRLQAEEYSETRKMMLIK